MIKLILIMSLFIAHTYASAQKCEIPSFNYAKMNIALQSLKGIDIEKYLMPKDISQESAWKNKISKKPIAQDIKNIFYRMQNHVFGYQPLKLETTKDINFFVAFERRSIFINTDLLNVFSKNKNIKDPTSLIRFILAHELGHYVQEILARRDNSIWSLNHLLVEVQSSPKETLGWNESAYEQAFQQEALKRGLQNPSSEQLQKIADEISVYSHMEVDAYAYLILDSIGGAPALAQDMLKSFEIMVAQSSQTPDQESTCEFLRLQLFQNLQEHHSVQNILKTHGLKLKP